MLPPVIPIFPLPNVVLFPDIFLPLHIFEPRYRAMVEDAMKGDRLIGMTLLRATPEDGPRDRPAIYDVGCAGVLTHVDRLDDGRYNILLQGVRKFRIVEEIVEPGDTPPRPYRLVRVEDLEEGLAGDARASIRDGRSRLEALLAGPLERLDLDHLPDEHFINGLSQYLELSPVEKQALLEQPGPAERCASLVTLVEMQRLHDQTPLTERWH